MTTNDTGARMQLLGELLRAAMERADENPRAIAIPCPAPCAGGLQMVPPGCDFGDGAVVRETRLYLNDAGHIACDYTLAKPDGSLERRSSGGAGTRFAAELEALARKLATDLGLDPDKVRIAVETLPNTAEHFSPRTPHA